LQKTGERAGCSVSACPQAWRGERNTDHPPHPSSRRGNNRQFSSGPRGGASAASHRFVAKADRARCTSHVAQGQVWSVNLPTIIFCALLSTTNRLRP
jgi:hypothetical protein